MWTAYKPLRENVVSYRYQSGIGMLCPDFDKCSSIHFWWALLGEESNGHLSPGTSGVITIQSRD